MSFTLVESSSSLYLRYIGISLKNISNRVFLFVMYRKLDNDVDVETVMLYFAMASSSNYRVTLSLVLVFCDLDSSCLRVCAVLRVRIVSCERAAKMSK